MPSCRVKFQSRVKGLSGKWCNLPPNDQTTCQRHKPKIMLRFLLPTHQQPTKPIHSCSQDSTLRAVRAPRMRRLNNPTPSRIHHHIVQHDLLNPSSFDVPLVVQLKNTRPARLGMTTRRWVFCCAAARTSRWCAIRRYMKASSCLPASTVWCCRARMNCVVSWNVNVPRLMNATIGRWNNHELGRLNGLLECRLS
jgi:hypothetical protein